MTNSNYKPVRRSARLVDFDYSTGGGYYVTVCTANRKPIFGEVLNGEVVLNNFGEMARDEWMRTGDVRDNVEIDEFVIMPNHIHGIIIIKPDDIEMSGRRGVLHTPVSQICEQPATTGQRDLHSRIDGGTKTGQRSWPLRVDGMPKSPSENLGAFIRGYKSAVTSRIWKLTGDKSPIWQRNYYEHVIRTENDLNNIRKYIHENPENWEHDEYHFLT